MTSKFIIDAQNFGLPSDKTCHGKQDLTLAKSDLNSKKIANIKASNDSTPMRRCPLSAAYNNDTHYQQPAVDTIYNNDEIQAQPAAARSLPMKNADVKNYEPQAFLCIPYQRVADDSKNAMPGASSVVFE
ncbi:hypothetical protein D9613_011795 [Agrocybe pediades]|uniref:Uncharacterized protein n=1 Tax=Agrocybe pediades TaxID=84607 RepID=A0A8H4VJZ6_9AGAR|nr:hypothetical protein D9613_011795 [Agrocybe pediades]